MLSVALDSQGGGVIAVNVAYDPGEGQMIGGPDPSPANFSMWVDEVERTIVATSWFGTNNLNVVCTSPPGTSSVRVRQDTFDVNVRNTEGTHAIPPQEVTGPLP
jgi:hypothetical protein